MTRLTAVVVPAAPALLPGIGGAADPLADLRDRARSIVAATAERAGGARAARLVVVAAGAATREWALDAPSGAERFTTGQVPVGALPTGLEIGRMLAPLGWGEPIVLRSIASGATPGECAALGRELVAEGPLVLLVVADGPATLTEKAPGHLQPDAAGFARGVRQALADADVTALAGLDPSTCDRLWMRGRPAVQVLAGAFAGADATGEVLAEESPFGVQYLLARWT